MRVTKPTSDNKPASPVEAASQTASRAAGQAAGKAAPLVTRLRVGRSPRATVAFLHDLFMAAASFVIALSLRLGFVPTDALSRQTSLTTSLLVFTGVAGVVFWSMGLYRGIWRYASLRDLMNIVRAVTITILIFLALSFLITRLDGVPRSVLVIQWFVLIFALGGPRMAYRIIKDRGVGALLSRGAAARRVPVLLIGAEDAADTFLRDVSRNPEAAYEVVGLVDEENGGRVGRQMHDVPILGEISDIEAILKRLRGTNRMPQRLILSRRFDRQSVDQLLSVVERYGVSLARLPRLTDFQSGATTGSALQLRPVAIEDLLGRPQASLDRPAMRRLIQGKRVLVTGAGGSIGSELARQAAGFGPERLILLDSSEFLLYSIDLEIAERAPGLSRRAVIGNVREREALERIFAEEAPQVVLHAAAIKHVPLSEANAAEAALTNVVGTRNVADLAQVYASEVMVQVSTDKAINPTNVMGATKRLAESYCQALDLERMERRLDAEATRFVTVRFGNVLGSAGSVVPLFQKQLARGGPLTVTHPEMTRYFMTIREAVQLVLQATALATQSDDSARAGKIYVLDMGEPVKIVDLARQMIRLAGLKPDQDVKIAITGLRPGEKLFEELFHPGEPLLPSGHPAMQLAAARTTNLEFLRRNLDDLTRQAREGRIPELIETLRRLVPEFTPQLSVQTPARPAALEEKPRAAS